MIVAIDLDNTLNNFADFWRRRINQKYGYYVEQSELKNYDMAANFPTLDREQVEEFLNRYDIWRDLTPTNGAQEIVKALNMTDEVYIVTARHGLPQYYPTFVWLRRYFPYIPEKHIIFAQNKELIRCDVLIDDCPANLIRDDCVTLQYTQPWNSDRVWGTAIVNDWVDVYQKIRAIGGANEETSGISG